MEKLTQLLLKVNFYPSKKKYTGCFPQENHHFGDCETTGIIERFPVLGDCGETTIN